MHEETQNPWKDTTFSQKFAIWLPSCTMTWWKHEWRSWMSICKLCMILTPPRGAHSWLNDHWSCGGAACHCCHLERCLRVLVREPDGCIVEPRLLVNGGSEARPSGVGEYRGTLGARGRRQVCQIERQIRILPVYLNVRAERGSAPLLHSTFVINHKSRSVREQITTWKKFNGAKVTDLKGISWGTCEMIDKIEYQLFDNGCPKWISTTRSIDKNNRLKYFGQMYGS